MKNGFPREDRDSSTLPPHVLHGILSRADDPAEMGDFVASALRRLTGATCVAIFECVQEHTPVAYRVVSVIPPEQRLSAESAAAQGFWEAIHELQGPACVPSPAAAAEDFPRAAVSEDVGVTIAVPLAIGAVRVGALVARGVPDGARVEETILGLESLAPVLALVLRNAFLCRRQAEIIEEQTRQLRESNAALRRREIEYRALADNQADVIMRFDRGGRHLYANAAAERVLGAPLTEIAGKSHRELGFPEPLCRYWEERIAAVFTTGTPIEEEFTLPRPGGEIVFNWRLFPEPGLDGVGTVLSVARDITEHRRVERSYRQLFEEMLDGFALHEIICNSLGEPVDYRFLSINPAFERLTGLRADDLLGRTVLEVMPGTEPFWIQTYGRVALTGEPAHLVHESVGLRKHFEVQAFRPAAGQFAVIFADVTERMRGEAQREDLERRLRRAQKMEAVGTLAGGIAHDFNNILTPIMAHIDLARMTLPADSPVQKDLGAVARAAERAAGLVRQFLALSRRQERAPSLVFLGPLVKEVLKLLRSTFPSPIEIREDIDPKAGPVWADPTQLHEVLINLCTNAREAMGERGGVLSLRVDRVRLDGGPTRGRPSLPTGNYTRLSVSDTGSGIAPESLERIFEPYFTTKAHGTGTGFGLTVVHGIVRLCGGDIVVESRPGEGSTFEVLLPESRETAGSAESGSRKALLGGREHVPSPRDR